MKDNRKTVLFIIIIMLAFILLAAKNLQAGDPVYLETRSTSQGNLLRIVNRTNKSLYCFVTYNNGYNYFDFYVNPNSVSRWHFEPQGYYEWRCQ